MKDAGRIIGLPPIIQISAINATEGKVTMVIEEQGIKSKCPKCKQIKLLTKHHIFDYHQVKKELLRIYDKPSTDEEHKEFQKRVIRIHKKIPIELICEGCHKEIEEKKQPIRPKKWWT